MTTTPWTIPANKALAFNKDIDYSLLEIDALENFNDRKIIVASNLIESVVKSCEIKKHKVLKTLKGQSFKELFVVTHF